MTKQKLRFPLSRIPKPRKWSFPRDHREHLEFPLEWWYWSGLLEYGNEKIGYHLAKFRIRDNYILHFSLRDFVAQKYYQWEGKTEKEPCFYDAGKTNRFQVLIEGKLWDFIFMDGEVVLQGEDGISIKKDEDFNYSYRYYVPNIRTIVSGTHEDKFHTYSGRSWYEHEFMPTTNLDGYGWAWFYAYIKGGGWVNGYLIIKDGGVKEKHSILTLNRFCGTRQVLNFCVDKTPTLGDPEIRLTFLDMDGGPYLLRISPISPSEIFRSSLRNYMEVPCEATLSNRYGICFLGEGYLEIT